MSSGLYERLEELTKKPGVPWVAVDEVNKTSIRRFCEAMRNGNPLYSDEEFAKKSMYRRIIAPPEMVQTWSMFPVWPPIEIPSNPFREAIFLCDKEGYDHLIAANTTLEFHKPLFIGDRLTTTTKFSKTSTEKKSMLGTGFFLTALMVHTNQKGELICNQYFTVFKYKAPN